MQYSGNRCAVFRLQFRDLLVSVFINVIDCNYCKNSTNDKCFRIQLKRNDS